MREIEGEPMATAIQPMTFGSEDLGGASLFSTQQRIGVAFAASATMTIELKNSDA